MASLATRAQEMLESDSEFRAQFDRSSASYHGRNRPKEYLEPVPLNLPGGQGARVPTEMKAHANWTALAVRDDGDGGGAGSGGAATSYGPEWEEACRLREAMAALKKAVSALAAPLEAVVKAGEKLAELEALTKAAAAAPVTEVDLQTLAEMPGFMPADEFDGAKPGFSFKTGAQGTGYYNMGAEMKQLVSQQARAAKAAERKRRTLTKQVEAARQRLESQAVAALREQMRCVDGTEFRALRPQLERLIGQALARPAAAADGGGGTMTMKQYRETWCVQQKRVTETIFRHHSVTLLQKVKRLKQAAIDAGAATPPPPPPVAPPAPAVDGKENAAAEDAVAAAAPPAAGAVEEEEEAVVDKEQLKALRKEEQALEEKIAQLMAAKNASVASYDEQIGAAEEALRGARQRLVEGGHYRSWYQGVLKES